MAVIKEYVCKAHGPFESRKPKCPYGCSGTMVEREFRTAPAMMGMSRVVDKALQGTADSFGLTDMRHNSNGSVLGGNQSQNPLAPRWGGNMSVGALAQQGYQTGNALEVTRPSLKPVESMIPANIRAASAKELPR